MMAATPARRGIVRSLVLFTAAQVLLIAAVAWGLSQFIWTGPEAARAIHISAWVAVAVQVVTFTIARLVAREQVIAGWGVGVFLRLAVVAVWAFLGIKALGLLAGPALFSLVIFFFVSTLVEPIFLNA
ncbi:MAG: hypothetical protein IT354_14940 [Gemmatimonadaceae bacterium]|nr:hypothetical protein [Gemmatimonadaceae bacterium]